MPKGARKAAEGTPKLAIPFMGDAVVAGFPSPAEQYVERPLDLNELLVARPAATYFARAEGDSMEGVGIRGRVWLEAANPACASPSGSLPAWSFGSSGLSRPSSTSCTRKAKHFGVPGALFCLKPFAKVRQKWAEFAEHWQTGKSAAGIVSAVPTCGPPSRPA